MKTLHLDFNKALLIALTIVAAAGSMAAQHFANHNHKQPSPTTDTSVSSGSAGERTVRGRSAKLGNGRIHTWARLGTDGKLAAIGVSFDEAALTGLPAEPPAGQEGVEYVLELPAEAAGSVYKSIAINWNPHGHGPTKIYDIGHFDFHFYLIGEDERGKITAVGDDLARNYKAVPEAYMPQGYIVAPDSAIAKMGAHLADPGSHEFHGKDFTKTFLYGAYDGKVIFLEPMITKAYLDTKPNSTESIKLPAKFASPGSYPTKYTVRYDTAKKEYTVALEGMTQR